MSSRSIRTVLSAAFVLVVAQAASAHPGHSGGGFVAGVSHPISGLDHILAMIAVGICAGHMNRRARWLLPVTFLGSMLAAGILAMRGMQIPWIEQAIAASIIILGLLIAGISRVPRSAIYAIVALFAAFHGAAHGAELQPGIAPADYAIGFMMTTALLLAVGVGIGALMKTTTQKTVQLDRT